MTHDTHPGATALAPAPARRRLAQARPLVTRRPRSRHHALAWAAAAALCAPAAHALDIFTANAPVYLASWFNGSYTETHEFQYAADWAGYCNAHAGADCQSIAYWNVAGNWDGNAIPSATSGDARVELGRTVRVGGLNSLYRGYIGDYAAVNTLSAAGRVEISGGLRVANASFADLHMFAFGRLDTTGFSAVQHLSLGGGGTFGGAGGTTQLLAWSPSAAGSVALLVNDGHTLSLAGDGATPATMEIRLNPGARLHNQGVLDLGGGFVELQGTANVFTLPVFDNSGTLTGTGSLASVRFNNAGSVALGASGGLAMAIGTHSGSFSGGSASTLTVGGVFAGTGHQFLATSSVNSAGDVVISRGNHQVAGSWNVARMRVQGNGQIDFNGPAPSIDALRVEADSSLNEVRFNSAGVALNSATIANGRVEFNAGDSTVQALTLHGGVVAVDGTLRVAQTLDWHGGWLLGGGVLRLPGLVTVHAGDHAFGVGGRADLDGTLDWQAGNFSTWSGHMQVLPSGRIDIGGDFNSAGGGGSVTNWGAINKLAGSGRADLGMAVHSEGGLARVLTGTLAFSGGGVHNDATFEAAPGARIELSGGTVFGRSVTVSGPLDVAGGSFDLLAGVQYAHAAGNRFEVSDLRVGSGARLQLAGALTASGSVHNVGTLEVAGPMSAGVDFNQYGSFALAPGASLTVGGWFTNGAPLTLTDSALSAGTLNNPSTLTLTGAVYASVGQLQNSGTLHVVPTTSGELYLGEGYNAGTLRVDGAANAVSVSGRFVNNGLIVSEGQWSSGTSFLHNAGARMENNGLLSVTGDLGLAAGSLLVNAGSVVANGGTPPSPDDPLGVPSRVIIDAGASLAGAGSFTQWGGLTVVNGLLRADAGVFIDGGTLQGAGTVQGPITVGQAALWRLGNSPGTFTVAGDATLNGHLEVEVQSLAVHDRLVVSGSFNAGWGSAIDIVFDPAFQPADGDTVQWLQAGAASVASATVNFSGLPAYWSAAFDPNTASVAVTYDLAHAIPLTGDHTIALGEVGYNAVTDVNNPVSLNRLYVTQGGAFSNRSGAHANINTLDNEGTVSNRGTLWITTLNNGLGASFNNRAGSALDTWALNNRGTLINAGSVVVGNWVRNAPGGVIEQRGTMTMSAPFYNGGIENDGRLEVAGTLSGVSHIINRGEMVIEPGGVVQGGDGGGVFNQYEGDATHLRVDGLLAMRSIDLNAGRLSGTGRLQGNVGGYARIEPGNSVGTLTVEGNLWAYGGVDFEIASATDYDRLVVSGDTDIAWSTFYLLGDFRPVLGDQFGVLPVAGDLLTGQWVIYRQLNPLDASQGWTLWADASDIYDPNVPDAWRAVFAGGTLSITAVPEPGTWALWLAGLGALGSVVARRRRVG